MNLYCVGGPRDGQTYNALSVVTEPTTVCMGGDAYHYRPQTAWQGPRCIVGTCHLAVYAGTELGSEERQAAIERAIEAGCVTWN